MGSTDNNEYEIKAYKSERVLKLFFRALKGESLSVQTLADEAGVSSRSITRDINDLKAFLADYRDLLGNAELIYNSATHSYTLNTDNLLTNKELLAVSKILVGSKAFNRNELLTIIGKLKIHTSYSDRKRLETILSKELFHYSEINFDCDSIIDNVWNLTTYIREHRQITITYYKMNRNRVKHRIVPLSVMFTEYYYYLIAYKCEISSDFNPVPIYFRIDRITDIIVHRETFNLPKELEFDEGLLRNRSQFMWPGPLRKIRFEFTGPSVQAILDRLPTAKIIDLTDGIYTIEAEVYGDGIKMYLLSQGSWVKVTSPKEFVDEMRTEIEKMQSLYQ